MQGNLPVSYTHLIHEFGISLSGVFTFRVTKKEGFNSQNIRLTKEHYKGCLLYTSRCV